MDPNQLFTTITAILMCLFDREEEQLAKREQTLVTDHARLGGSKDGFRHMGLVYTHLAGEARKRGTYDRLAPDLVGEMTTILDERKTIQADKERIRQALAMVLRDTRALQDIRDALPNCLQHLLPQIKRLERTREEAYTLVDNPRAFSQYNALKEKIEFYVAARLLY